MLVALAHNEERTDSEPERFTRADQDGENYSISGEKHYVVNGDQAQMLLVSARTDSAQDDSSSSSTYFLLSPKLEGITITPVETLGYKGAHLCHLKLENVQTNVDAVLGGAGGLGQADKQLAHIQDLLLLTVAAEAVGMAQGAVDYTLNYARGRKQFGQAIGKFPAIQSLFAEMTCEIDAARWIIYHAAWLAGQNKPFHREVAKAKYLAVKAAQRAAMEGLQIFGGYGYSMEYDIQRYVRDAMALSSRGLRTEEIKARIATGMGL
jgi:alkylation response protein AidB-like acyl-CoA dehydrogenase